MPSRRYINSCTDSRLELTDAEVLEVHERISEYGGKDRRVTIGFVVAITIVNVLGSFGARAIFHWLRSLGVSFAASIAISMLVLCAATIPFMIMVLGGLYRRHVRQALIDCGHPVCVGCGYLLEGTVGEVCPECGRRHQGPRQKE